MPTDIDPAPEIEAETQRKKTALLFRNVGIAQSVNVFNATLLAYVNSALHVTAAIAVAWWGFFVAIAAWRYLLGRRFMAVKPDAAGAPAWRNHYVIASAMTALAWGAGTVLFMWHAPDGALLFTGLVIAATSAGAVPVLAPVPAAFRSYVVLSCLPMSATILLQAQSPLQWSFGAMTVAFLVAVLTSGRYLHETLDMAIRLGLNQGHMVEHLKLAQGTAESALAEQKKVEATLQASEERYRLILQHSPMGVVHYDNDLVITYCNNRFAEILRAPMERVIGLDMKSIKDKRILPALRAPIDGQEGAYVGLYETTLSGWKGWVSLFCTPFLGGHGENVGGIAFVEDITERKEAEAELEQHRHHLEDLVRQRTEALMATEARASHILNASAAGLYGLDLEGHITFMNPAACNMLGYRVEQVLGRVSHEVFHRHRADGSPYPIDECPSYQAMRSGQEARSDNEVFWHADGHPLPVMAAMHPILENGVVVGGVTSFVDVSEQRAAAQAREQALLAAENLARMRSEFLSNMSHEIRTPLSGVLGFAKIGARHYLNSAKALDAFNKIQTSGDRLLRVVNDILDFSKIEAGKLHIEQVELVLENEISHAMDVVHELARSKGLELRLDLAPDLPVTCVADPFRLGQVLLNLLSNAVKFTQAGKVSLAARRHGDELVFQVSDSGIGMSAEQLATLFTPFHQVDGSHSRRFGGTGLGLAISKRLLDLMGGHIRVTSRPGEGSTFEFRLPYVRSSTSPAAPAEAGAALP